MEQKVQGQTGRGHGRGGRKVLKPVQIARAKRVLAKTPRGERRKTKIALGKEFGCHWRTVENAVKEAS